VTRPQACLRRRPPRPSASSGTANKARLEGSGTSRDLQEAADLTTREPVGVDVEVRPAGFEAGDQRVVGVGQDSTREVGNECGGERRCEVKVDQGRGLVPDETPWVLLLTKKDESRHRARYTLEIRPVKGGHEGSARCGASRP
jgi:hypothetical protein